jgi:NADH dehydrogenase [ubiquinone] 1 alpha subcomplex assembly factor 7
MTERLDAFMARANAAYYATHDPFADFTTAPEITQVFGEVLGLWAAVVWGMLGHPSPVVFAEAGPGRGTLMADALRAISQAAPDFRTALRLHLIETSPRLRAIQADRLPEATWHASLDTLPGGPLILLANEFLDALPIRQFVRRGGGWNERFVTAAGMVEIPVPEEPGARSCNWPGRDMPGPDMPGRDAPTGDGLIGKGPAHDAAAFRDVPDGAVVERGEAAAAFIHGLSARIARVSGAALILDYGPEHSCPGDSLQAIAGGRPADPLRKPGTADITAHVDFARLAGVARQAGAAVHGPVPQGLFLAQLGLFRRSEQLASRLPPARGQAMLDSARRLAEPNRMGRLFKALAVSHPGCPALPGLA